MASVFSSFGWARAWLGFCPWYFKADIKANPASVSSFFPLFFNSVGKAVHCQVSAGHQEKKNRFSQTASNVSCVLSKDTNTCCQKHFPYLYWSRKMLFSFCHNHRESVCSLWSVNAHKYACVSSLVILKYHSKDLSWIQILNPDLSALWRFCWE